jgi:hypothetical protein
LNTVAALSVVERIGAAVNADTEKQQHDPRGTLFVNSGLGKDNTGCSSTPMSLACLTSES